MQIILLKYIGVTPNQVVACLFQQICSTLRAGSAKVGHWLYPGNSVCQVLAGRVSQRYHVDE